MSDENRQQDVAELEFRLACLDRTVEQLDEVVTDYSRTIEAMKRLNSSLEERLRTLERRLGEAGVLGPPALLDSDDSTPDTH